MDDVKEVAKQMEKKRLLLRKKSNITIEDDNSSHSIKDSHFVGCLFWCYKYGELLFRQYCKNSNKNECALTESIKMSLKVTQDVPQDVTQGFN